MKKLITEQIKTIQPTPFLRLCFEILQNTLKSLKLQSNRFISHNCFCQLFLTRKSIKFLNALMHDVNKRSYVLKATFSL